MDQHVSRRRIPVRMTAKGRELPSEPGTKRKICTTSRFSDRIPESVRYGPRLRDELYWVAAPLAKLFVSFCRPPDFRGRRAVALPEDAIEVGQIAKADLKRYRADAAPREAHIRKHSVRTR
jgi:hypothetical protein